MIRIVKIVCVATFAVLWSTAAEADDQSLIVGVESADEIVTVERAIQVQSGEVRYCSPSARLCIVDFETTPSVDTIAHLSGVTWVERDRLIEPAAPLTSSEEPAPRVVRVPFNDIEGTAGCGALQELSVIRADEVWERGISGSNAPVVAIVDTGFYADHLDLRGLVAGQYDYGDLDDIAEVQPMAPIPYHGTFMAGLIAANPSNDIGRAGIAPYCRLFLQRIVDSQNNQYLSFTVHALADIADNHPEIRVVVYSIIPSLVTQPFEEAVSALGDQGVLFVASAGNCLAPRCVVADNDVYPIYPQNYAYDHIVVVASSDSADVANEYTHFGQTSVDLFAPSYNVCSLDIQNETSTTIGSGTSYAAPLVGGAAALVMEAHPGMRTVDVGRAIKASAFPVPDFTNLVSSGGRLDAAAAVAASIPDIGWPSNIIVEGTATFSLDPVSNYGARGDATIVLLHSDGVELSLGGYDPDWEASRFEEGMSIDLPDAGTITAPSVGLLIRGAMDEHVTTSVPITLRGVTIGVDQVTVRIVLVSAEGTVLGSPYANQGSVVDATGFEAHPFSIEVTSVASDDMPADIVGEDHENDSNGCMVSARPHPPIFSSWIIFGALVLAIFAVTRKVGRW